MFESAKHHVFLVCTIWASFATASTAIATPPEFMQKTDPQHVRVLCYNVNWDSIFPYDDPNNHPWRAYDMVDQFRRVVAAVHPDIVCLQEINADRDPQDVADILDEVIPLDGGEWWRAHKGSDNVIAARWNLLMPATDTIPTTNRDQAMALVDLPDDIYRRDLYLMNAHFKASGGTSNINRRKQHAAAIIHWIGDAKTPGEYIDLPTGTPIVVLGDLNVYDTDPHEHLATLVTGDISSQYESMYGPDLAPDWDETDNTDALPLHNGSGPEFYTWRSDGSGYNSGALDRIIYSDSVLSVGKSFVLNTTSMSIGELLATGLEPFDVVLDPPGDFDHLPLVVDFIPPAKLRGDWNNDGTLDLSDWTAFLLCVSGPEGADSFVPPSPECLGVFDFDTDSDVDLADCSDFQVVFASGDQ